MTDEEYVRSRWKKAYQYQSLSGVPFIQFGPHALATWSAAAEFTRQREEEIRQLLEEIAQAKRWIDLDLRKSIHNMDASYRILARLESALAELLKGMKEQ